MSKQFYVNDKGTQTMSVYTNVNCIFGLEIPVSEQTIDTLLGQWVLCLKCSRCYRIGEYRTVLRKIRSQYLLMQLCPYSDCYGAGLLDTWLWSHFRDGSPYPDKPKRGEIYRRYVE